MQTMTKKEAALVIAIHKDFDSAQERLLLQAKEIISKSKENEIPDQPKADQLRALGFTQAALVREVEQQEKQNLETLRVKQMNLEEANLIGYYKSTYPFLKFLTEAELDRICTKYNLIHAPVANYIGEVPDHAVKSMTTAQPLKPQDAQEDSFKMIYNFDSWETLNGRTESAIRLALSRVDPDLSDFIVRRSTYERIAKKYEHQHYTFEDAEKSTTWLYVAMSRISGVDNNLEWNFKSTESNTKTGLFICAPEKDFNTKGLTKQNGHWWQMKRTEVKDPVVYRYVRGGVQVLAKWGLEAADPALLNEIDN